MLHTFKNWLSENKDWHGWPVEDEGDFGVHHDRMLDDGMQPEDIGHFMIKIYRNIPNPDAESGRGQAQYSTMSVKTHFQDMIKEIITVWWQTAQYFLHGEFQTAMDSFEYLESTISGSLQRAVNKLPKRVQQYGSLLNYLTSAVRQVGRMIRSIQSPEWRKIAASRRMDQKRGDYINLS